MALIDFVNKVFGVKKMEVSLTSYYTDAISSLQYKAMATEASINLITRTFSKIRFQTFEKGVETHKTNHYLLNVEANKNQSSIEFWKSTLRLLLLEGEALILMSGEELYLASSFNREVKIFEENKYSEIQINKEDYPGTKKESEVLYLKDDNSKMRVAIDSLMAEYTKLISSSIKGYSNSKSRKGVLDIPASYASTLKEGTDLQEHFSKMMKDFMDPEKDAVFPQTNKLDYEEIDKAKGSKSNDSGRETKNFINDIFDFIAISYGIPPSLLKGDVADTEDAFTNFITFCINPLAELVESEVNRKLYGKERYLEKTYTRLDTSRIKAEDYNTIANSIELLTRTGTNTINDNLKLQGKEPLDSEVGEMRFITKNLEFIDNVLENGKTGNPNETVKGGD